MIAADICANLVPLVTNEDPDLYGMKMLRYLHFFNVLISVQKVLHFVSSLFVTVSSRVTTTGTSRTRSASTTSFLSSSSC